MSPVQYGLTPAEYLQFRERYLPEHLKIIFVSESPPKSGKYFYLSSRERDELILADFPGLVEELRKCAAPDTKVVLVKANVCQLLDSKVTDSGFMVLNQGKTIPFPSTGQQKKFREAVRPMLGLGTEQ